MLSRLRPRMVTIASLANDMTSARVRLTGRKSAKSTAARATSMTKTIRSLAKPARNSDWEATMFSAVAATLPGTTRRWRTELRERRHDRDDQPDDPCNPGVDLGR